MRNLVAELIAARPDDWLEILRAELKIQTVEADGLVSLKYDQIESPMGNPLVQQCRGMVVDLETCEVVAWPYDKFWNLGEARAAASCRSQALPRVLRSCWNSAHPRRGSSSSTLLRAWCFTARVRHGKATRRRTFLLSPSTSTARSSRAFLSIPPEPARSPRQR